MIDVEARIGVSEAAGEDRAIELEDLVRELAAERNALAARIDIAE